MVYVFSRNGLLRMLTILICFALLMVIFQWKHVVRNVENKIVFKNDFELEVVEAWNMEENFLDLPMGIENYIDVPKEFLPNCTRFPKVYDVQFHNANWQTQKTKAETYFLYSSYLDVRGNLSHDKNNWYGKAFVRILGMSNFMSINEKNSTLKVCQFWFQHKTKPVFSTITEIRMTWFGLWGSSAHYFPYLISCRLPSGLKELPISVSVAPSKCFNATNNLSILHRERLLNGTLSSTSRKGIAVCVKALDFPDNKVFLKLVEWIETLRLLGANKIFFYEYFVDSEVKKLLNYYENQGIVGVTQTTLPGELPNQPHLRHLYLHEKRLEKRLTELVPYNDCFYKNMYDFEYIAVIDTDEIILPTEDITWSGLLKLVKETDIGLINITKKPVTTFCFENFYFLDSMLNGNENSVVHIPHNFHMLRHIYRSHNSTGKHFMKCFHDTDKTLGVHNHFEFFCREGKNCNRHYIDTKRAQMNHYRPTCVAEIKNCSVYIEGAVKDANLWRYASKILKRVQNVLRQIK